MHKIYGREIVLSPNLCKPHWNRGGKPF